MTVHSNKSDQNMVESLQAPTECMAREHDMMSSETHESRQNDDSIQYNGDTYILYLIRHGEAKHNVLEKAAREKARKEAEEQGLGPEETKQKIKKAQEAVLNDPSLLDAPLTKLGEEEAEHARQRMLELQARGFPEPEEVLVSPLQRALQTANLIFPDCNDIHVREDLIERQTGRACDHRQKAELLARRGSFQRFSMVQLRTSSLMKRMLKELEDVQLQEIAETGCEGEYKKIEERIEEKPMLQKRTKRLGRFLMNSDHQVFVAVTHKAFLRELERGTFGNQDAPEFSNCEVRVYKLKCENYDLTSVERIA